jgi:hypothetical protein
MKTSTDTLFRRNTTGFQSLSHTQILTQGSAQVHPPFSHQVQSKTDYQKPISLKQQLAPFTDNQWKLSIELLLIESVESVQEHSRHSKTFQRVHKHRSIHT